MKPSKTSFFTSLVQSFGFAFDGFRTLLKERNFVIHLIAAAVAVALGAYLQISTVEWCIIVICIGLVLTAEGFNTAIELLCDRITKDKDPTIVKIKDISASAVLILALVSIVIAGLIFLPKII